MSTTTIRPTGGPTIQAMVSEEERAAREALRAAGEEFKAIRAQLAEAREVIAVAMVAALKAGVPQKEVQEMSGFTRESVRSIAREGGVGPSRRTFS